MQEVLVVKIREVVVVMLWPEKRFLLVLGCSSPKGTLGLQIGRGWQLVWVKAFSLSRGRSRKRLLAYSKWLISTKIVGGYPKKLKVFGFGSAPLSMPSRFFLPCKPLATWVVFGSTCRAMRFGGNGRCSPPKPPLTPPSPLAPWFLKSNPSNQTNWGPP